ncbi:gamma carbonic anhydrase family protein [Corynebacterium breve]|uniref:Gamma carbonic anhydrase family protein n=1 Tax=Corynebacterium breve TaxID=3049799 RepID=A0ABY8VDV0_9CORY|nr:gamma carbonic anhydrase family protein [Corynebacterium breve]WIM67839.1 gamma carbonic anhydrase family protein [Corynebacterium breve]
MIYSFEGIAPTIDPTAYVAPEATIIGDVHIGPDASVFPGAVLRGDVGPIRIGARTNIQDGAVVHVDTGGECTLGDDVTVGHLALVHSCIVGNGTLVGMHSSILSRSTVGSGCIIGGGAVVLEGAEVPAGSLVAGVPGKVKRSLDDEAQAGLVAHAGRYVELARRHREGLSEHEI